MVLRVWFICCIIFLAPSKVLWPEKDYIIKYVLGSIGAYMYYKSDQCNVNLFGVSKLAGQRLKTSSITMLDLMG